MSGMVRVAAAVMVRPDGRVLLAQRPHGKPYAGYWEFPGGKLEPGETPRHALERELREELGIDVTTATPWMVQEFVYPHAHVELNFFRVFAWRGEPHGHDGQAFSWQQPGRFDIAPLLPANTPVMAALLLPPVYGITCAGDLGEEEFLARAEAAFARGLAMVQVREKDWPAARVERFAQRLHALARVHGARVLLNGEAEVARRLGLDGVHWSAARLMSGVARPDAMLVGASCHDARELARAADAGCDFAVMGPVRATPTHPGVRLIGWDGFVRAILRTRNPVYALGGLTAADLPEALTRGAHGIAMRRGAWTEKHEE